MTGREQPQNHSLAMNRSIDETPEQGDQTSTHTATTSQHTNDVEEQRSLQEEQRARELSRFICQLQCQLRSVHSMLGDRYRPDLESKIERLTLERDEALISWGRALLGLCESGASLRLTSVSGTQESLIDHTLLSSEYLPTSHTLPDESSGRSIGGERIFGEVDPSSSPQLEHERDYFLLGMPPHLAPYIHEESVQTLPLEQSLINLEVRVNAEADVNDEEVDDPGIADAPRLSLNQFSLTELRERMLKPKGWGSEEEADEALGEEFAIEIALRLGAPREWSSTKLKEHLIELEAEVECCQRWSGFQQELQHAIVTLVTSRLRDIQDRIGESTFDQERIAKMFRRLTRFSSDFRPGFVHGLSRDKVPEHESWRADEMNAWRRLEEILDLQPNLPKLTPERADKLQALELVLNTQLGSVEFSNALRAAVTECLNVGLPQESPHLVRLLEEHLSHLSGKRFKKLRLAVASRV